MGGMDIVGLTLGIEFIGSLVFATIVAVIGLNRHSSATPTQCCKNHDIDHKDPSQIRSSHIDAEYSGINASQSPSLSQTYVLRPRLLLWIRQTLTFAFLSTNTFTFIHNHEIGTDVELDQQRTGSVNTREMVLYYASHLLFISAMVATLWLDDQSNLNRKDVQRAWMPVYGLLFVHRAVLFFCTGTFTALVQMILALGTLTLAAMCAYRDVSYPQVNPPTPEYTCGLLAALSFSHINANIIIPGMKKASFAFEEDVPKLSDADSVHEVWKRFRTILLSSKELNLWWSLYLLVKWEWIAQGCFQFLGCTATYITPLALERILLHIANHGQDDDAVEALVPISIELAVVLLFVGPLLACVGDGQNYVRGRHIGIRVKGALIAAIYNKALSVDLTASKEGVGKLNNLMSVDVSDIQSFCCYSHMVWSTLVEILISSTLLYVVLGRAAFGGLIVMVISLGIGLLASKLVERFQGQLLKCKDARMGIVSEVLNSMRVIKYYAWERKFTQKINAARRAEVDKLRQYAVTNAMLYTFWEIVPAVVGATAFVLHTYYLGRPLTPATGFTALTLFNLLRFPLDVFPDMLNFLVRTKVSLRRIEAFLRTPDVKGITDACAETPQDLFPTLKGSPDHEFAPKFYREYALPSATSAVSGAQLGYECRLSPLPSELELSNTLTPSTPTHTRSRSILHRARHASFDAAGGSSPLPPSAVGTVVLTGLTLAWSPTLREEEGDEQHGGSGKSGSSCASAVAQWVPCMSRTRTAPPLPAAGGSATASVKATLGKDQKYQRVSAEEDEESTHGGGLVGDVSSTGASAGEIKNAIHSSDTGGNGSSIEERVGGSPRARSGSLTHNEGGLSRSPRARSYSGVLLPKQEQTSRTVILENTTFTIPQGALAVLVGVTGSGKSSLLQAALLGEGLHLAGSALVGGRISYASQSAWIQNATLRDNVLFGTPYDKERYDKVVFSCALLSDFKLLPAGDMTEIGEKGVNLSGGQQQRVSLARAAYAYSDVILLDDPLSAVDTLVGEHIFKELVTGFLRDRTRLLVTHNMSLAMDAADLVICLDACAAQHQPQHSGAAKSRVLACCPPSDLPQVIQQLKYLHSNALNHGSGGGSGALSLSFPEAEALDEDTKELSVFLEGLVAAVGLTSNSGESNQSTKQGQKKNHINAAPEKLSVDTSLAQVAVDNEELDEYSVFDPLHQSPKPSAVVSSSSKAPQRSLRQNNSYESLRKGIVTASPLSPDKHTVVMSSDPQIVVHPDAPVSSANGAGGSSNEAANGPPGEKTVERSGKIVDVESKSVGRVGWQTYWFYFKACGGVLAVVGILGGTALSALAWLFQNISLGEWMYSMEHEGLRRSRADFRIYALGVLLVLLTSILRAIASVTSNLTSANHLHDRLINSVMNAPCGWFDATPVGRIVNRFSQDISTVDSSIIGSMYHFVDRLLATTQIVAIICISLPVLMLPLLPVVGFTWWVSRQYLHVSRELKRLESLKKSPVFVLFSETLQGLPIVRAFRAEGRFFRTCCERIDEMNRCHIYLWISNRWLSFRMQVLGAAVAGLVGLAVVLESGRIGSTVAGIVLIYSLGFCESLTFLARAHADCQMDLNSIERIQEYSNLPAEKGLGDEDDLVASSGTDADIDDHYSSSRVGRDSINSSNHGVEMSRLGDHGMDTSQHPLMALKQQQHQLVDGSCGGTMNAGSCWPSEGHVEFRNIFLKYASCATPVLRDVSFSIPGKTKLGVVGRTGAGKSSLIAALFRLVEPTSGELLIDGVNVLNISLHELRNNVAIVPQEPTLFRGSVRFNLDPFDQHTDEELWAALTSAHLAEHVRNMPCDPDPSGSNHNSSGSSSKTNNNSNHSSQHSSGGNGASSHSTASPRGGSPRNPHVAQGSSRQHLTGTTASARTGEDGGGSLAEKLVAEKGSNFSLGQRQLLCMARAILRKASVLVLDECTASVDHETDALIQETVRKELGSCTVICIAHRLHTIAYYDNVLVMDQGRVAECDAPFALIQQEGSIFRQMCVTSGDFDELYASARDAHEQRAAAFAAADKNASRDVVPL